MGLRVVLHGRSADAVASGAAACRRSWSAREIVGRILQQRLCSLVVAKLAGMSAGDAAADRSSGGARYHPRFIAPGALR
ncbi:hypothetical protein WQQ_43540 [Hydrocarboniphaga effusa AP103]|uniref:Uncharacterized protein n=1 Tax=Hydrocarboniphaga effusa AP103 TaxID=1172194 RepID=I7Z7Y4_9GAMM|nr:hypothetical protein WQQ_43540 [Hydrocarboniphaga effusa AP103]